MDLIKTKSFELAILSRGDRNLKKLAILIPGRLDTKDYANFVSHAEYLANRGFFAIAFDPPGTWESPGEIDIYTTGNYIKAINELIEYLGNKPTLLLGHSRGGSAAILAGGNVAVTGIVLIFANYEMPTPPDEEALKSGFQISYRDLPLGDHETAEQKTFKLPLSYWKDAELYDPLSVLKKFTKPKLMVYTTRDEFYSPEEIKEIYRSIPEPKMIKEVDSDHDYRRHPEVIREVETEIGRFLDKYHI
jgi:pimeloyl-ACP methyl ester carboxylesterase